MKFLLLKLTALSLASSSGVYAIAEKQALRGSLESNAAEGKSIRRICEDGKNNGKRQVDRMWERFDEDCNSFQDLEYKANDELIDDLFRDKPGANWRVESLNWCAREAVQEELTRIEDECGEGGGPPELCRELGETAAEEIVVFEFCSRNRAQTRSHREWNKECKEDAYVICEGDIASTKNRLCRDKNMDRSELLELQRECMRTVDDMVRSDPQFNDDEKPDDPPYNDDEKPDDDCDGGNGSPCDPDVIFCGEPRRERADMERVARNGNLKREYPGVWKSTKQARNRCKKHNKSQCKTMGICGEAEFDGVQHEIGLVA